MPEKLTAGERKFCEYQKGITGGFFTKLFKLMEVADGENLELLRKAFPEHVEAYHQYGHEKGYWTDLKIKYFEEAGVKL